jgi:hypothetical protein
LGTFQPDPGTRIKFTPLFGPPPLPFQLLRMPIADDFALHRRRFALLAIRAEVPAAPIIGITLGEASRSRAIRRRKGFSSLNFIRFLLVTHPA